MDNVTLKVLAIEADNEVVLKFPFPEYQGTDRFEMLEAVLASNPVFRLVDSAEIGDIWDGSQYVSPVE